MTTPRDAAAVRRLGNRRLTRVKNSITVLSGLGAVAVAVGLAATHASGTDSPAVKSAATTHGARRAHTTTRTPRPGAASIRPAKPVRGPTHTPTHTATPSAAPVTKPSGPPSGSSHGS